MDVTEAARARVVQIAASITAPVDDGTDIATLCEGVGLRVVFGRNEADFEFLSDRYFRAAFGKRAGYRPSPHLGYLENKTESGQTGQ